MSKAILVIDNPNMCADCPLRCSVGGVQPFCSQTFQTLSDDEYYNQKPDWCPLRRVPEKADLHKAKTMTTLTWCEGFNACIDIISREGGANV